jgi:hypothetical protein
MKVNHLNYESYFLLYIDNELSTEDRASVELFLHENSNYREVFENLQSTVLPREEIIFEHKELLFRLEQMEATAPLDLKESLQRKEATIVNRNFTYQSWLRYSAMAACVLLILGYGWYNTNTVKQNNSNNSLIANKEDIEVNKKTAYNKQQIEPAIVPPSKKATLPVLLASTNAPTDSKIISVPQEIELANKKSSTPEIIQASTAIEQVKEKTMAMVASASAIMEPNAISVPSDNYNEVSANETDKTIYIANFEIDAEKFRGISRRINALLKITKTDKEK